MSPSSLSPLPTFIDVLDAAARIAPYAQVTPVLRSRSLEAQAGAALWLKAEHLQRVGAFKFRGACNAVFSLDAATAARGVVTHSSGNHGAALALAARLRGIPCHVVVPEGAVQAKLEAIVRAGAVLHRCAPGIAAREAACAQVQAETGATLVHPYADSQVIAGQGTAALELLTAQPDLDALVVPLGGGGLAAGSALALQGRAPQCRLYLAEPAGAADGARAFARGVLEPDGVPPDTICDGLRGTLGAPNFALLRAAGAQVLTVEDADTRAALRLLWSRTKQLVEPSAAITLAAVLAHRERFAGARVGLLLSGGNVDLSALPALLEGESAA
ncbi:pyridoxal-phosphate dependent enzyme [Thermomonas hydrothermalis]|uniref:Threonine dehydratase n=1 Tax=Thermomonas hydrothermalis TaxID=213588 RepID=A0A1M4U1N9_9GAMM|nr:pyridoxal-phosphate dependent enzyme [Thermomonas hydrothermalis]MCL6619259.1 pyridoxal-phosphate dependent enzyme [Thermomonas hydrothermalis]SHE50585.1 threonine dehydratase [Thermomonas hydrothermalis]